MTVKESLLKVVTPAKAGVQTLIRDEVKCCSNFETGDKGGPGSLTPALSPGGEEGFYPIWISRWVGYYEFRSYEI
jgi:hypothetical protein